MNDNIPIAPVKKPDSKETKPNEKGGFYISTFIKITDPNSGKVLLQTRGDT